MGPTAPRTAATLPNARDVRRVPAPVSGRGSRGSRPLSRLEVGGTGFDPTGETLLATVAAPVGYDPLAPVATAWSVADPTPEAAPTPHPAALRELADRAGVQVSVLRHTLEEAIRLDRAVGGKAHDLAQRLEQAGRFEREMDQRLEAAGRAMGVLNHAAAAVISLEKLIAEIRGTQVSVEESLRRELAAQQARVEQQLADQEAAFASRLAAAEARLAAAIDRHAEEAGLKLQEHSEAFGARLVEVSDQAVRAMHTAQSHAASAESEAVRLRDVLARGLQAEMEKLNAAMERQTAQARARVAVVVDDAAERVADLERTAARVGVTANERLEKVCDRAAGVLGYDPRRLDLGAEPARSPAPESLADLTQRAEAALKEAHEHLIRIALASERAGEVEVKLSQTMERAGEIKSGERLVEEAAAAEQRLAGLRDDLESTATSVRYNVSQAQQVEAVLAKTIDRARDKAQTLDRAMDQVTQQAGSMVHVARDVAGLVQRAEQARTALTTAIEAAAQSHVEPAKPIRGGAASAGGRRAPFGPPKQVRGDDNAAAA